MREVIRKEYMASVDELKELFPIGTVCYIDNKTARVIEINEPMAANCMASYPSVTFVVVDPDMSMDVNKLHPTAYAVDCTSQMINAAEAAKRIREFIDSRTVTRDGEKYLPIEENTVRRLMQDLTKPDTEYYAANDDDFRSRA